MNKRNKFNIINSFYNEYPNNIINIDQKKRKKYLLTKNLTIQNNNNNLSPQSDIKEKQILSLSSENFDKSFDFNKISKTCIMNKDCPYYKKYKEIKSKLKSLLFSFNKIKTLNEILNNSLEKQSKLYQSLINENKVLKEELFYISSQKKYLYKYKNQRTIEYHSPENKKVNINMNQFINKEIKTLKSFSLKNIFDLKEKSEEYKNIINLPQKNNSPKLFKQRGKSISFKEEILTTLKNNRNINLLNNPNKYYDLINQYTNEQNLNFVSDKIKRSFLSEEANYETIIQNNKILNELISLTKSQKNFISKLKVSSNDTYCNLCNMISLLIADHKEMLQLGIRMKDFIKYNILLIQNMNNNNNVIKILLKNICIVLCCEYACLYVLENLSDSLIAYQSGGVDKKILKKRIPKNEGIIGSCFIKNKKIRIDDDKNSVLYYPLINKAGECFGVLEAKNKLNPPFNNDDEELAKLLSSQASNIFLNFNLNDDNNYLINKLNNIIDYNINIVGVNSKFDFTTKTENVLLSLFNCSDSKFYFYENNKIVYYNILNKEKYEYDINTGIIGKVIKTKKTHAIQKIEKCNEYNDLVDIKTFDGLLTFPVLEHKTKNVKGIVQITYIGTVDKNNKPKEVECMLIKKVKKCIKYWLYFNKF